MAKTFKQVLIIDDDPVSIDLISKVLENRGFFMVRSVKTTALAQQEFATFMPHLIFLGLKDFTTDGVSFLEQRLKIPTWVQVPVIVMMKKDDEYFLKYQKGMNTLAINDFLEKPMDAKGIIQKTKKHIKEIQQMVYEFPENEKPQVFTKMKEMVILSNNIGFIFSSPLKLAKESIVQMYSEFFGNKEEVPLIYRRTEKENQLAPDGAFFSEMNMIGITSEWIQKIRKKKK